MFEVIGLLLPVFIGYLIALAVYLGCTFGFARFAGKHLAVDGRPLPGFWVATAMSWLFATIAATYYVVTQAVYPIEILGITLILLLIVVRSALDFRDQQPRGLAVLSGFSVLLGTGIVWKLVH